MEKEKNRRVIYNILSNGISRLVVIIMSLIIPRMFLSSFGSEVNGLVSTVKQVFSYLTLLEAGVGMATIQALYRPVAEENRQKINGILSATKSFLNKAGIIYILLSLTISTVYSLTVETPLDGITVFTIFLIYALPTGINFLIKQKYALLITVEGKDYIFTNIAIILEIITDILKIWLLKVSDNIILIQSTYCLAPILQMAFTLFYMRKNYGWLDLNVEPDVEAISQQSSVLVHQISGAIFGNVDIILLSIFCDFKIVSVYTVYMMFFRQMEQIICIVTNGITFRLGQMFQVDRKNFLKVYEIYENCYMSGIFAGYTLAMIFLLPVIKLYTKNITDITYINSELLMLFVLQNLISSGKLPSNQVIEFEGAFKETRNQAIIEMTINLTISIYGIWKWGICGGLIGTIVALVYRANAMILYANRKILSRSVKSTYKRWCRNFTIFTIFYLIFGTESFIELKIKELVFHVVTYGISILLVYFAVNLLAEYKSVKKVIKER
jgi:hypothetical protein